MNILQVANFISELLHTTDCVTIPNFGAFVSNEVSAKLDASKHKITPPGPQISFNKNIKNNDGLLANFIATKQDITYDEAISRLQRLGIEINETLQKNKSFEFGVLGTFYISAGNILKFEPGTGNPNFDLGLHSMTLSPLANESWAYKHAIGSNKSETNSHTVQTHEHKKSTTWGKVAAAVIALPILAYLAWMPSQTNIFSKTDNFNFSELNPFGKNPIEIYQERTFSSLLVDVNGAEELNEFLATELPQNINNADEQKSASESSVALPEMIQPHSDQTLETIRYQLIGGCFGNKSNAENLIEILAQNGIDAEIYDFYKGLHRVTLGGYASETEARAALKDLKNNYNTSTWVLKL